jgi:RNA polymerase sigma-70 factor (ECF subfamily)
MSDVPDDRDLIRMACAGDARAFEDLLARHYDTIFRFSFQWCRNESDAQDITQTVCIGLARAIHHYKGKAKFTTWLYRVVINTAIDWQRQNKRHLAGELHEDMASSTAGAETTVLAYEVLRQIERLPEKEKTALLLVVTEDMSHAEIAVIMQVKESTVSWYVHEARKKLGMTVNEKERHHG